jgi:hypothetical protein
MNNQMIFNQQQRGFSKINDQTSNKPESDSSNEEVKTK